jgi:hypothetical protein
MTAIYSLIDPVSRKVRYIGKTDLPIVERLKGHLRDWRSTRGQHTRKNRWIASLLRSGLRPVVKLVEIVPRDASWEEYEALWIKKYRILHSELIVNFTDGGQGPSGHRHSEAAKGKLSAFFKGRSNIAIIGHEVSEETRKKISAKLIGRPTGRRVIHSPETIARISAALTGKKLSSAHCKKLSEVRLGRRHSKETKRKLSTAAKRRIATPAGKAQMLNACRLGMIAAQSKRRAMP